MWTGEFRLPLLSALFMLNPDSKYKAAEAAKLIERTSVDVARLGQIVTPEIPANGKGYRAFYSFRNLVEMRLAEELGKFGIPQKRIERMIEELRKTKCRWLDLDGRDGVVILDRNWKFAAGDTIDLALRSISVNIPVTSAMIVDLGIIKRAIRRNMEQNEAEMDVYPNTIEGEILDVRE